MKNEGVFTLQKENIWAVPIIHYNMEMAAQVRSAFNAIQPDCVAVELAETMQLQLLHAASRLPDVGIVVSNNAVDAPLYYLCEPCDGAFEGLRSALEARVAAWCIDLDIDFYPDIHEDLPDPYAIQRIGLKNYYEAYQKMILQKSSASHQVDSDRELYMAKRLKELSLRYEKVLFVGGMRHIENIFRLVDRVSFPDFKPALRKTVTLYALTDGSRREVMAEFGWMAKQYEALRSTNGFVCPDRQKMIYDLFKIASDRYIQETGNAFPSYHMRNIMKFLRNYAIIYRRLMPDLFQILTAAKGCVDHNYAYEVWELATEYPFHRNIDNLPELDLSIEEVWGQSKIIRFHLKERGRKNSTFPRLRKNRSESNFKPPGPFNICSFPPEDVVVERFGEFLKKKGMQIILEEASRTIPFSTSLEDGIDARETIRHWHENKIYVKAPGKPPEGTGSIVIIFDPDAAEEGQHKEEIYSWKTTWLGEHSQESDMAFYATPMTKNIVGPGISRCEYGGFMMSYPPRRMYDIWSDPDYQQCRSKNEVLLLAAIDYAVKPLIAYVAAAPPRSALKSYARRFGKKVVYIPIGQLSPISLNKLRVFHVLDGRDKRNIAGEYIY